MVEAMTDHDQPRPGPMVVRNLGDVIYVANTLAGTHVEWSGVATSDGEEERAAIREGFADLLPEIESDSQAMRAVFA